jgi:hypothetical protein
MKEFLCLLFLCFFTASTFGQSVSGNITDEEGKSLPYASIIIKGTSRGVVASSQGRYQLQTGKGSFTIICQYLGYKAQERKVQVESENLELNFSLGLQDFSMEEVVIKRGEDPAIQIMKETIKKRDFHNKEVDSFTVDVYLKGLLKSRFIPDRILGARVDKKELEKSGFDSVGRGIMHLSESVTKVSYKKPNRFKYDVISSRSSGGGYGISFPIFINFYENNVQVFSGSNPRGFVSPVSDNAFHYYKFKYEGNFFEGDKMINKIRVTPRRKFEPLFSGHLYVVDGEWKIHSLELETNKDYELDLLDTIKIKQIHAPVSNNIWKTHNQVVYVALKFLKVDITGNFLNVFNNYDLDPGFGKKHFNRILMTYDTAANKRDSIYWSEIRPVPLEPEEKRDFVFKDSLVKSYRDSMFSKHTLDSMRRNQKPIRAGDVILTGVRRNIYTSRNIAVYRIEPLITNLSYNTVEGIVFSLNHSINFRPRKGSKKYELSNILRYGFNNRHFNPSLSLSVLPGDPFSGNNSVTISGGKRVSQFNKENPIGPLFNSFSTLLYRDNWMKIYENVYGSVSYQTKYENGWRIAADLTYEERLPLQNTSDFSFYKKNFQFLPNHPYELAEIPFEKHKAVVTTLQVSYQPGQYYIQYPHRKVSIGSKAPTFTLNYSKGINGLLGSVADFDKWNFNIRGNKNFKLKGNLKYHVGTGGFMNTARVDIPDFKHFIGNQTLSASEYLNSFQLAPYYRYSNTEKIYGVLHLQHHFNGLITNKIPLFNRLKWNLVAGTNTFYVNRDNYYAEVFVGVENILKIFRIDFITAYQAEPGNHFGIRLGAGGLFGGMFTNAK